MTKAWCIWCEEGTQPNPRGYYWIHEKCSQELMDYSGDLKDVKEMLQGVHLRNEKDQDKLNVIFTFIKDMEDFKRRWDKSMEFIKQRENPEKEKEKRDDP